jgi:hypothetical protein
MEATNVEKHRILPAEEIHRKYYSEVPDDVFTKIVSADVVSSNLQRQKLGKTRRKYSFPSYDLEDSKKDYIFVSQ